MPNKSIFDISCENLDLYFDRHLPLLTPEAKDGLPKDIIFKIFRKGGVYNSKSTSKLSFLAKLYILFRSLRKRWYLVIEDEENGIGLEQFKDLNKTIKGREYSVPDAERFLATGSLVLADKELSDTFSFLNRLGASGAYNYVIKAKNASKNRVTEHNKEKSFIAKFLANYDSQKKNIVSDAGITIPELYILLTLFSGEEVQSSWIYREKFKRAYQSTPSKIKLAFKTLQNKGYIRKFGVVKAVKLQITPLGKEVLNGIFDKYVLNC